MRALAVAVDRPRVGCATLYINRSDVPSRIFCEPPTCENTRGTFLTFRTDLGEAVHLPGRSNTPRLCHTAHRGQVLQTFLRYVLVCPSTRDWCEALPSRPICLALSPVILSALSEPGHETVLVAQKSERPAVRIETRGQNPHMWCIQ